MAVFGTAAGFAIAALATSWVFRRVELHPYKRHPPETTVELHGGAALTLAIHHKGLPCKVRARVKLTEFAGEDPPNGLPTRPEPFDVHLQTRVHGGSYRQIAVDEHFDLAKAQLATLSLLDDWAQNASRSICRAWQMRVASFSKGKP
jgi:hypothetical protein